MGVQLRKLERRNNYLRQHELNWPTLNQQNLKRVGQALMNANPNSVSLMGTILVLTSIALQNKKAQKRKTQALKDLELITNNQLLYFKSLVAKQEKINTKIDSLQPRPAFAPSVETSQKQDIIDNPEPTQGRNL
jgi:translation initiation factor 2B subunit (eIF-2B alpha/beta/delta family)